MLDHIFTIPCCRACSVRTQGYRARSLRLHVPGESEVGQFCAILLVSIFLVSQLLTGSFGDIRDDLPPSPSWLSFFGLVLGAMFLDVLQAILLIDFSSIIFCASFGPGLGASCCVLQRHILHSLVCEDPPSVLVSASHPTEGYDSRDTLALS